MGYNNPDRPLVTFALFAYNQEQYIREAVGGAFSQTYSPLEVILSDDCSSDRTFEIMREMAQEYRGPHKVILARRSKNLGIAFHVNKVFEEAAGRYVVMAAGDDVSLPDRTKIAVERMIAENAALFFSDVVSVGGALKFAIEDMALSEPKNLSTIALATKMYIGATGVIEKTLFKKYGPLKSRRVYEDQIYGFRAALEGRVTKSNERLVRYRLGGVSHGAGTKSFNMFDYKRTRIESVQRKIDMFSTRLADIQKSGCVEKVDLIRIVKEEIANLEVSARAIESPMKAIMEGHLAAGIKAGLRFLKTLLLSRIFHRL